jgi:hypothetical protein
VIVNELDRARLEELLKEREAARLSNNRGLRSYLSGRIDEFCAQKAIDDEDLADLAQRVFAEGAE